MTHAEWKTRFEAWRAYADRVNAMAQRITASRHAKGWAIARPLGMTDMCCVHNASISEPGHGWGADPRNIKAAKRALFYLDDWRASRLAERIVNRAFPRV
jgi:hypothetical protein